MDQNQGYGYKTDSTVPSKPDRAFKSVDERMQWVYESKSADELRQKYDAWANVYESDLKESWFVPIHTAALLETLHPHKDISILDAGAGTGMVGAALNHLGYDNITAIDLSPEMLKIARQKNVYTALHEANLEEEVAFCAPDSFAAITAIGVFTYGHVGHNGILNLLPLLQSGGLFILTVRTSNEPMLSILSNLDLELISQETCDLDQHLFYLMAYRKRK